MCSLFSPSDFLGILMSFSQLSFHFLSHPSTPVLFSECCQQWQKSAQKVRIAIYFALFLHMTERTLSRLLSNTSETEITWHKVHNCIEWSAVNNYISWFKLMSKNREVTSLFFYCLKLLTDWLTDLNQILLPPSFPQSHIKTLNRKKVWIHRLSFSAAEILMRVLVDVKVGASIHGYEFGRTRDRGHFLNSNAQSEGVDIWPWGRSWRYGN